MGRSEACERADLGGDAQVHQVRLVVGVSVCLRNTSAQSSQVCYTEPRGVGRQAIIVTDDDDDVMLRLGGKGSNRSIAGCAHVFG